LLVQRAADAIGAERQLLDEAAGYATDGASYDEVDNVLGAGAGQYRDILDHAQGLDTPPGIDLVLDVIQKRGALPVAPRQPHHLVRLGRFVDVDETGQPDVEVEPCQVAVIVVHFLAGERQFIDLAPRLLHEYAALADLDGRQPLGALVGAVPDHDSRGSDRLIEIG
jgi:hypothetical protein